MVKIGDGSASPGARLGEKLKLCPVGPRLIRSVEVGAGLGQPFELENAELAGVDQAQAAAAPLSQFRRIPEGGEGVLVVANRDLQALFGPGDEVVDSSLSGRMSVFIHPTVPETISGREFTPGECSSMAKRGNQVKRAP